MVRANGFNERSRGERHVFIEKVVNPDFYKELNLHQLKLTVYLDIGEFPSRYIEPLEPRELTS
jgi:hypothetical protein